MRDILRSRITTLVLLALATAFGIHVLATQTESLRLDATADNIYSLSEGSREILAKMRQEGVKPVDIKLYFSETSGKTLPRFIKDFLTYETYIETLLDEYEAASGGKIRVQVIDPLTDSDEAQDALDYGLDGKPINQHGDLFFFGLVFQTQTGSKDVIEFLWPNRQETLEYEIARRMQNLLWPTRQRIGVLSSLEVLTDAANPYMRQILAAQGKNPGDSWVAMQLLEESYQVSAIDKDTDAISHDDYDLVIVVHPKELGDRALWALDEWVVTGGNTLIFVDPYSLTDTPPQNPQQPWMAYQYKPSSNLDPLLRAWGIERPEDQVVADFDLAVKRAVAMGGAAQRVLVDLQIDEQTAAATLDDGHPILKGLSELRFFLAGSLREVAGDGENAEDGITRTPLITTTAAGNTIEIKPGFPGDGELVFGDLNDPGKLQDRFEPGSEPVAIAYQLQGRLPSAYPDGADVQAEPPPPPPPGLPPGVQLPPPTGGETVRKEPVADDARQEATVMVFADVDFISDQVAFQQSFFGTVASNDNHKVLLNAVDYLFGSEELMKIRSKKPIRRPFTLFDDIEAQADRRTLEREKELRADIDRFQQELQEKQQGISGQNVALFEKQLQDEVGSLNERIDQASAELREIRKAKRKALEGEEGRVRFATLWMMPTLVLAFGLFLFFRRRWQDLQARRTAS